MNLKIMHSLDRHIQNIYIYTTAKAGHSFKSKQRKVKGLFVCFDLIRFGAYIQIDFVARNHHSNEERKKRMSCVSRK